ncbi:MAG TPA: hypothetical protein PKK00_07075 [Bacteroidales bacterium]|nr:hypothetical protein [Bacteroidales bacterium]HPS17094.1 hypothetical protein [Bacteroidales bacterium]
MKKIILPILFALILISVCNAQTITPLFKNNNNDKNISILLSHTDTEIQIPKISFHSKLMLANYSLFYDPSYNRQYYFEKNFQECNKKYFLYNFNHYTNDPLAQYNDISSVLIFGTINYISLLFEKH